MGVYGGGLRPPPNEWNKKLLRYRVGSVPSRRRRAGRPGRWRDQSKTCTKWPCNLEICSVKSERWCLFIVYSSFFRRSTPSDHLLKSNTGYLPYTICRKNCKCFINMPLLDIFVKFPMLRNCLELKMRWKDTSFHRIL